jgi:hypothetical protein
VTFVGILWVVLAPYCTGMIVIEACRCMATKRLAGGAQATIVGWLAAAALCAGVFAIGGQRGMAIAVVSAPLVGLAFWIAAPGPDDDPPADDELPEAIAPRRVRLPGPRRTRPTGHGPVWRRRDELRRPRGDGIGGRAGPRGVFGELSGLEHRIGT